MHWDYDHTSEWASCYKDAEGHRQSPINIQKDEVVADATLNKPPLACIWSCRASEHIVNTGHGWKVHLEAKGCYVKGGPLPNEFSPDNFHCHWGPSSELGSEHTIDGEAYAGEIHIVHWNCVKYKSCEEASGQEDGLAVIGILLKEGQEHREIQKIVDLIPCILNEGGEAAISKCIELGKFIPESKIYYTYPGSLTTPPCTENVIWIVYRDPIEVSEEQLAAFRTLRVYKEGEDAPSDENEGRMVKTFRPVCDLYERVVREGKSM